ncbi:phosphatase PAP2 family protein [Actinoplanes sp. NBC_00393]|uniref:phosphatase PAP2 family protein n=1 Tax=Actinoplanes sp. NBC_00393 TaxID=2975953 RepID=UPI002E211ED5
MGTELQHATAADRIRNVPDVAGEWYVDVVTWAHTTPGLVQAFMKHFTEFGIVVLAAIWALAWWRARAAPARTMALAFGGAVGVVLSYGLSEWAKTYLDAERPCRTFSDLSIIAGECPPTGDWSFPSNHSTIAGALLVAILLVNRRLGLIALPIAALAAFSRVFVGVHYPHDVVAGLLLGVAGTAVVALFSAGPLTTLVTSLRRHPRVGPLLSTIP